MKKISVFLCAVMVLLCSCKNAEKSSSDSMVTGLIEQTVEQLQITNPDYNAAEKEYTPLNYETQAAMWLTYMNYADILWDKTKDEFTESIKKELENISDSGFNTVYVHVSAFNDAYYRSDVYPQGKYCPADMDFDPLEIITQQAHRLGLSVHAWINPLRCQTDEEMKLVGKEFKIGEWYLSDEKKGKYIVDAGGRWYLNPAYEEVRGYICSGIGEITGKYDVDGIHIDDYFYPETDVSFDAEAFAESGGSSLDKWRTENISRMVSEMYSTVKSSDERILFGVSPQGNIDADYDMYADVKKWGSEAGYCDYIVPQLYYGFENETCPFEETADEWRDIVSSDEVKLVAGICTYKIGTEDKWAGEGRNEWIENEGIPAAQAAAAFGKSSMDGIAVYSYESTFKEGMDSEISELSGQIKEYTEGK
ncbi:MAG: glycoside hydrolase family 10 protein [Porcipelethomonas sp.]